MVVREGKRLRALEAGAKPDDKAEAQVRGAFAQERLDRPRADPRLGRAALEWRQMLREVWRLQRDQFWVPDMSGVDWEAMYRRYEPLLARVATRGELSDLIWEMQGELGTSHAYEVGGDHRRPPALALGYLAAELRLDADERRLRDHADRDRRCVGRGRGLAAERRRRRSEASASASSRSTASARRRATRRRSRCSCTRRDARSELTLGVRAAARSDDA